MKALRFVLLSGAIACFIVAFLIAATARAGEPLPSCEPPAVVQPDPNFVFPQEQPSTFGMRPTATPSP